jgi:serine/threonine-protein kinase
VPPPAGLYAGPYELLNRLAVGGMGEVYVARRRGAGDFEKRVAVKLLLPHLIDTPEFVQRFLDEARLSARMAHPNIVEIFDLGESDGRPYIAMQLVDGVSLAQVLALSKEHGREVPLPLVRLLATGLCEALGYAHALTDAQGVSLGLVHRDVNPSNVLISTAGQVLLTDFGIAKATSSSHQTEPGRLRGKVSWMAPEQLAAPRTVDARADVYATALTLYATLAGRNPMKRESDFEALRAVTAFVAPPPVTAFRPDATPAMAKALARCLTATKEERFPDLRALREAFVDGPVATAPELAEWVRALTKGRASNPSLAALPGTQSLQATPTRGPGDVPQAPHEARPRAPLWVGLAVAAALSLSAAAWLGAGGEGVAPGQQALPPPVDERATVPTPDPAAEREGSEVPQPAPSSVAAREKPEGAPSPVAPEGTLPTPSPVAVRVTPEEPTRPPRPTTPRTRGTRGFDTATPLVVGYLTADAEPWADVLVNGRVLDRTPFARYPLKPGRYTLLFRGPNGLEEKRPVTISAQAVTAVRVELQARTRP